MLVRRRGARHQHRRRARPRSAHGIGTRLLAELAWAAIERGCAAMTLEVRVTNVGAQELYRRFGFAPAGVRKRYYENTEDAIVMWCHDIDTPELRRAPARRRAVPERPGA